MRLIPDFVGVIWSRALGGAVALPYQNSPPEITDLVAELVETLRLDSHHTAVWFRTRGLDF